MISHRTPLWNYSVRVYGRPGVAFRCLELQDAHGFDVTILLAALWAAGRGKVLGRRDVVRLEHLTRDDRRRVTRLRARRRALPRGSAAYEAAKRRELRGEAIVMRRIVTQLRDGVGARIRRVSGLFKAVRSRASWKALVWESVGAWASLCKLDLDAARASIDALMDAAAAGYARRGSVRALVTVP